MSKAKKKTLHNLDKFLEDNDFASSLRDLQKLA